MHAAAPHLGLVAGAALDAVGADHPQQRLLLMAERVELLDRDGARERPISSGIPSTTDGSRYASG